MELKPGVVLCDTFEDAETLFQFLHENGATWASGDELINGNEEYRFLGDPTDTAYEIAKDHNKTVLYYFGLCFTSPDSSDFEDLDGERAKEAGLFWVSSEEYIAAHERPITSFDSSLLAPLL